MTEQRSDDERFAELIDREFGEQLSARRTPREEGGFRTWSPAEEPEAEDWRPPPPAPAARWHHLTLTGAGLIAVAIVAMLLAAFGVSFPPIIAIVAGAAFVGGITLLLYRLSGRKPDDTDGAVL